MIANLVIRGYSIFMNNSTNKRKGKLTNSEIQDRVDIVLDLLAQNKKRMQIMTNDAVQAWNVTPSSVDKYIKKARDDIALNSRQARTEHLGTAVMNLSYLYKVSLEKGDHRLCLDIQREKNRLLKLDQAYLPSASVSKKGTAPKEVTDMIDKITIVNSPLLREV